MTGKKLLGNEDSTVLKSIELKYGSTDNYYNELYLKFLDRNSAIKHNLKARKAVLDKQVDMMKKEISVFGSENADSIFEAIRLDAEILITKRKLVEYEEELAKYDTGFLKFWNDIKHKFGFNV